MVTKDVMQKKKKKNSKNKNRGDVRLLLDAPNAL